MAILYTIYIYILYTICKDLLYIFPNHHKECSSSANWESALNTSRWESAHWTGVSEAMQEVK